MSNLEELIERLCPDGVEYKELSEVLTIRNGKDYKHFGEGNVPVYGSGGIMTYIDTAVYEKPSVLIPRKGSLDKLYFVQEPFWTVDTIFYTDINVDIVEPKYIFYYLQKEHLEKLNKAGGVPSLTQSVLNKVKLPVPPLEVQREIVRILDNFTFLTTELAAELAARQKQYEYYRDLLLNFENVHAGGANVYSIPWLADMLHNLCPNGVVYKTVGEIANINRGKVMSKDYLKNNIGKYPVYSSQTENNGQLGAISTYMYDGNYLTWTTDGANAGTVFFRSGKFNITNVCGLIDVKNNNLIPRFLYYFLNKEAPNHVNSGMGNPKLMSNVMSDIKIPVPPLAIQQRIVGILDRFDTLCNDISSGLPAEIEMRQKQYEYYRDKLLTFKELKKEA